MERMREMERQKEEMLKGMLRTAEETNQIAIDINVELHGQGEKMKKINGDLNKVNKELYKAE